MQVKVVGIQEIVDMQEVMTETNVVDIGCAKVISGMREGRKVFLVSTTGEEHVVIE